MSDDLAARQEQTFTRATASTTGSFPPERRLTGAQLSGYLDRRAFAVVGTARPDGRPHAAMSSYVRRGTTFWLPAVTGSVRGRNVRHQPWATLVITEGDRGAHIVVQVEGTVAVVVPGDVPADVRAEVTGDWVSEWLRLEAERVLSYAAEGALPGCG
jgi:predicted pyridoxine 5'-phosphate oxidase superfamily flavin-nucleotide-binding protein